MRQLNILVSHRLYEMIEEAYEAEKEKEPTRLITKADIVREALTRYVRAKLKAAKG